MVSRAGNRLGAATLALPAPASGCRTCATGSLAAWIGRRSASRAAHGDGREGQAEVADYAKIFKAYDIRGVVPDELDEGVAEAVGAAFARLTGATELATVHDMRTSSAPLAEAFARGATAQGSNVVAA